MFQRLAVFALLCAPAGLVHAQWSPSTGQWGKTDARDVRVMAWNVQDGICSSNSKLEGATDWCCLARIVAAMKPDVLILEETADNSGNGTGAGVDSVPNLLTTISLFQNGGTDPFRGGTVTAYVKKYAPSFDMPYVYVSANNDGFNRNVIMSRYPFTDLNGDGKSNYDQFINSADLYAPGGGPGIRGWTVGEIDLPNASYRGDLVIGGSHLKSGGAASDYDERLTAAKNIAYYIDYFYNGGGTSTVDPRNKIFDLPVATRTLDAYTPVIWGGDLNEDENTNGRDGPALWTTRGPTTSGDGTDRDRTDCTYDDSRDPNNAGASSRYTQGSSKLDYICWQDSIATLRRSYVYSSSTGGAAAYPPEIVGLPNPFLASLTASDHKPVIADFILPQPPPPGNFALLAPADGTTDQPLSPELSWAPSAGATGYWLLVADNPWFGAPTLSLPGLTATSYAIPAGLLAHCANYYWKVTAVNSWGATVSTPAFSLFRTIGAADFNSDGAIDFFDYDDFVNCFEGGACPPGATADFDGDGTADFFDYDAFVTAFETAC